MPDREKLIKHFEHLIDAAKGNYQDFVDLTVDAGEEILTLLKEQEPTTFKPHYIDEYGTHFICGVECGSCHEKISRTYHYCPYCGKAVKWE